jgi:hypothetical protein
MLVSLTSVQFFRHRCLFNNYQYCLFHVQEKNASSANLYRTTKQTIIIFRIHLIVLSLSTFIKLVGSRLDTNQNIYMSICFMYRSTHFSLYLDYIKISTR